MNIIIHVGPPKSGTSAIQKWLLQNHAELKQYGIYYPQHQSDPNGVSSGNLLSLFTRNNSGKPIFDQLKKKQLIAEFETTNLSTLLLSSEFFFKQIEVLAKEFPTAIFVAYLRFPVEVIESSYNQSVKRHGEIKRLGVPAKPQSSQLNTLERSIKQVNKGQFVLRPYNEECFVGHSLINDFKDVLGIPVPLDDKTYQERVNSSYALDALEFKRWFNQFPLGELQHLMDRYLQAYSANKPAYSLIPAKTFRTYKREFVKVMERFCNTFDVNNSERFIECCEKLTQKPIQKQNISLETFERLYCKLLEAVPEIRNIIFDKIIMEWSRVPDIKAPERLTILRKHIPFKIRMKLHLRALKARLKSWTSGQN